MDFSIPERVRDLLPAMRAFVEREVYAVEREHGRSSFRAVEPRLRVLRDEVKSRGWWAPQLPTSLGGMGLTLVEHGLVSEVLGRSMLGHYVFNCQAPDAGNMEILVSHGIPTPATSRSAAGSSRWRAARSAAASP
jgi:alkylation response protein AidB-like acyl-CoA dehydrogenase